MFKKKWFNASKGTKKKEKLEEDEEGDYGVEFIEEDFGAEYSNRILPPPAYKGPNSVTFQVSGPRSFAIVGRNKTIRDVLKKMVGSRLGTHSLTFEALVFSLAVKCGPFDRSHCFLLYSDDKLMTDPESGAFEFDFDRREGVKNALSGLGYDVNDIPSESIKCMENAIRRSARFAEVDLSLMPPLLMESLLPFQRTGVEFAIQRGGKALICDDMGLGKTIQGIAVASYYMSEWPCLILAQSSLKRVWSNEFEKWIPGVKGHIRVIESGAELSTMGKTSQITIMAYDLAAKMSDTIRKLNFKVILADESHMLKSVSAQRTRALVPILRSANRTILLSGTPALSRPSELFPQLLALHSSIWPTMKGFGLRYCNAHQGLRGWDYTGNSNLIELNALLTHTVMIRRLKEAVLSDLPPKVRKIVEIEKDSSLSMDPIQNAPTFEDSLAQRLEVLSEQADPENMAEQELAQVAGTNQARIKAQPQPKRYGPEESENEDILAMYREASVAKQDGVRKYVRQLIAEENASSFSTATFPMTLPAFSDSPLGDETSSIGLTSSSGEEKHRKTASGRKFLLFAHHLPMLDVIENELLVQKIRYIRIDGETSTKDRALYVKQFQEDDTVRAAVLSMTCASTGLTLTSASLVVFAELYWNPGTLIQAEDRVHRLGQTAPFVELRYLFCKGTVDDHLWPLIGKKLGVVGSAINGAKDRMALDGAKKPVSKSKITSILPKRSLVLDMELDDQSQEKMIVEVPGDVKKTPRKRTPKASAGVHKAKPDPQLSSVDELNPREKAKLKSSNASKHLIQREITSFLSVQRPPPAPVPLMDPIVIDDSQESVTPVYASSETSRKRAHGSEETDEEFGPPAPKKQTSSLDFLPMNTPIKTYDDIEDVPTFRPQTEPPMRSKTTEWTKTKLSFLSPAPPLRLGFKK